MSVDRVVNNLHAVALFKPKKCEIVSKEDIPKDKLSLPRALHHRFSAAAETMADLHNGNHLPMEARGTLSNIASSLRKPVDKTTPRNRTVARGTKCADDAKIRHRRFKHS